LLYFRGRGQPPLDRRRSLRRSPCSPGSAPWARAGVLGQDKSRQHDGHKPPRHQMRQCSRWQVRAQPSVDRASTRAPPAARLHSIAQQRCHLHEDSDGRPRRVDARATWAGSKAQTVLRHRRRHAQEIRVGIGRLPGSQMVCGGWGPHGVAPQLRPGSAQPETTGQHILDRHCPDPDHRQLELLVGYIGPDVD